MKRAVLLSLILLFVFQPICAQNDQKAQTIALLQKQLKDIEKEEKEGLKKRIENINSLLNYGVIDAAEADRLKLKAAEAIARKIEERQTVILETISYLENKGRDAPKATDEIDIFLDVDSYSKSSKAIPLRLSKDIPARESHSAVPVEPPMQKNTKVRNPTSLDLVFAMGLNNTVREGITWRDIEDENDYLFYSSRFFEIGFALKTPLVKKNGLRLKYGLSFQTNELEPTGNRFFDEVDGQTSLQESTSFISESRFVVNNLVLPVHLEFGPTKMKQTGNRNFYSTSNKFKIGVGGYIGLNIDARQKLRYPFIFRGRRWIRGDIIDGYDINNKIYGLSAYVGIGAFSLYGKYDLNTIFDNGVEDEQFVSVGFRVDL